MLFVYYVLLRPHHREAIETFLVDRVGTPIVRLWGQWQ